MRKSAATRLVPILVLVGLVLLWQVASMVFKVPAWKLPSPWGIGGAFVKFWAPLMRHTWVTLAETLVGFGVAVAVSVPLGVLIASNRTVAATLYPILVVAQSIPKAALAPVLVLWIGFGTAPKILIAFLVAFFPVVVNTAAGIAGTDRELMELCQTLRASRLQTLLKVQFPSAMPYIFDAMKVAVTLGVVGAVIGEFVGADAGLGYQIQSASSQMNTNLGFAAITLLAIMGIGLFQAVQMLEHWLVPWARKSSDMLG
jgi:NitT/TauT family transport system permease protein